MKSKAELFLPCKKSSAFPGLMILFIYDLPGGPTIATAALVPIVLVIPIKLIRTLKYRRVG